MMNCCWPMSVLQTKRKWRSISGSVLLVTLLLAAQAASRPADETTESLSAIAADNAHYGDVDNVELHHAKIIDGTMHENHPVIMYREDFVSEDYDPSTSKQQQHKDKNSKHKKYKHQRDHHQHHHQHHREEKQRQKHNITLQYNLLKPEKIYFDVLPQQPIILAGDDESKFDASSIRAELVPLYDDKQAAKDIIELQQHNLKRQRRELSDAEVLAEINKYAGHKVQKRNPYYRTIIAYRNFMEQSQQGGPQQQLVLPPNYYTYPVLRHPVQGKRAPVPMFVGSRADFEDANQIWDRRTPAPRPTKAPAFDLWHDSDPDKNDFSQYTTTPRPALSFGPTLPVPKLQPQQQQQQQRGENSISGRGNGVFRVQFPTSLSSSSSSSRLGNQCLRAERTCCATSNLSSRFDCFYRLRCQLGISEIIELCD